MALKQQEFKRGEGHKDWHDGVWRAIQTTLRKDGYENADLATARAIFDRVKQVYIGRSNSYMTELLTSAIAEIRSQLEGSRMAVDRASKMRAGMRRQ